jgi:hypothetical protein
MTQTKKEYRGPPGWELGVKWKTLPHKNIYFKKTSKMPRIKWRHLLGEAMARKGL